MNFITVSMFGEGESFLELLIQRLFFDKILDLYSMYELCFSTSPCRRASSLTPAHRPLFVSSQSVDLVVGACLRSFHWSTHFPPGFLIYVKPGLVGPRGTLFVSFIHPVNKNSSLVPEQQLTDDSQKISFVFNPALCMASKHNAVLKCSFCFKATEFSFGQFITAVLSNGCRQAAVWQRYMLQRYKGESG